MNAHVVPLRLLTEDLPGTGGVIKQRPEDFLVEEIPAYDPCGEGEHIYLMVQKTSLSTLQMVSIIARHFRVRPSAVGYAGLKDKHAITRQAISVHVPGKTAADFPLLHHPKLTILGAVNHTNKLRRGHLLGNRFAIKVRGTEATRVVRAQRILQRLEVQGVPNRLGEQRFGHAGNNHEIGRAILLGDHQVACDELVAPAGDDRPDHLVARERYLARDFAGAADLLPPGAETETALLRALARGATPRQAVESIGPMERSFYVTSFQSAIFNALLEARGNDGTLDRLLLGDLAYKHENGAVFSVDGTVLADPTTSERLARLEVSPSGPMWGPELTTAGGAVGEAERQALDATGVTPDHLAVFAQQVSETVQGKRRALRVPLLYPQVEGGADEHGPYVKCVFELPAGSFATVVMREVIKPEPGQPLDDPSLRPYRHDDEDRPPSSTQRGRPGSRNRAP
ncbi:MAG: tRNA pseudouridine(13) synthase TruD [Phycisphaerales bacterium]